MLRDNFMKTQNMQKFLRLISPQAKNPVRTQIISPDQPPIKHEEQTASP